MSESESESESETSWQQLPNGDMKDMTP